MDAHSHREHAFGQVGLGLPHACGRGEACYPFQVLIRSSPGTIHRALSPGVSVRGPPVLFFERYTRACFALRAPSE